MPAAFDPDRMRQALLRLDLSVYAPLRAPIDDYCRFYGIDLERHIAGLRHYCGWFEAADCRISAHVFLPEAARGTVFIVHGYLDHSGLYRHVIEQCVRAQYAVFIYDLPGHGLSDGARASIADFQDYQTVLDVALGQYGSLLPQPFRALGQSTGGAILIDHVLSACKAGRSPAFEGVLLLAPLVRPAQWSRIRFGLWIMRMMQQEVPRIFRHNTSDEAFLRFVREQDPLQERWVPLQWVAAMRRWVAHISQLPACRFPVMLVQGHKDETVSWQFNINFVRKHFQVWHDVGLPEASHQLVNEREDLRQPVHQAIALLLAPATSTGHH